MPIQETVLEKQEPRVAIASKTPQESGESPPNVGILTLLQTSRREQAARQAAEEVVVAQQLAAEEARVQASGDEIEWKNLFLGKRSEDNDFRKIRLCIVQRDETLDLIASRYSLNPREIINHNRLNESTISEGQLLYIP
nr:LysM peptidoglycan-binding domain-containing protein [Paenibacillus castaneae]